MKQFAISYIPIVISNIPFFLINAEWLIPKVFIKRGVVQYLLLLLGLFFVFAIIQFSLKLWLVPSHLIKDNWSIFHEISGLLFVTAISSGYASILFLWQREGRVSAQKEEHLKSELSFLRSQISPHFIFNALNSIVFLVRSKSDLAEPIIIKLSELMRYMLYESSDAQVPLDRELMYLENYISLQRIRFEEDVDIRLEINETFGSNQFIEPMLLIPFVENAFKHGIGLIQAPYVSISIKTDKENTLHFKVKNKIAPTFSKDTSSGIGLQNVKRRLELLYPNAHQLIVNKDKECFEVYLHLVLSEKKQKSEKNG